MRWQINPAPWLEMNRRTMAVRPPLAVTRRRPGSL